MADIKLRIELNPNASKETLGSITNYDELGTTNENLANTSFKADENGVFQNVSSGVGNGSNGLTWAYDELLFSEDGYLDNIEPSNGYLESEQNPTQFFWGVVPEDTKYYYVKLVFSNATSLKDITIMGDKVTNQFPTRAVIDGSTEIFSDDAEWNISFLLERDTHTIEFTHWSRGNYNATIAKIAILGQYLYIDGANGLKSVETLTESSSNPSDIFYGVLPNSGSADFVDVQGEFYDMITDNVIPNSGLKIDVLANGNVVGSHYTEDSNYDVQSQTMSFDMGDALSRWDSLIYAGYDLQGSSQSAYEMLVSVFSTLGYSNDEVDNMLTTEILYGNDNVIGSVKSYLQQIIIQYPYLVADTYRNTINKFCKLAQLQLVEDNGKLVFVSARPTATHYELNNCIEIGTNKQFSQIERSTVLKNKISGAKLIENVIGFETKAIASVGSGEEENTAELYYGNGRDVFERNILSGKGNSKVFGQIYSRYRDYTLIADLNKSTEIFEKNVDKLFINQTQKRDDSIGTFQKSFFESIFNLSGSITTVSSESTVELTPTIVSREQNYSRATINFESVFLKYFVLNTLESEDLAGGETFSQFEQISSRYYLMANCLTSKSSEVVLKTNSNEAINEIDCTSELLQSGTTYKGTKMSAIILQNVLKDYHNGIADASLTVSCADYYNENGEKVKEWASGEIIKVGDIVSIKRDNIGTPLITYKNGDEYKWRVKSVNFRKVGVPFVDIKLQQICQ